MNFTKQLQKISKIELLAIILVILSSLILLVDTLNLRGQPANMDGIVHVTNIAIFHDALRDGDFPVRWTDGFANYGLPMGSFAQQFTSYLGAFFTFATNDPLISFNIVYSIGTVFSALLFYWFARLHFKIWPSFVGTILFNFSAYRIINLYIRGAIPEYFSTVFLLGILISLHYLFKKKSLKAYLFLAVSTLGIILSHPMNVVTGAVLIAPYLLYLLMDKKHKIKWLLLSGSGFVFGLLLSAYYTIPLLKDISYFFYGQGSNHFTPPGIAPADILNPNWFYFITERNEILSRGHFIKPGFIEISVLSLSLVWFFVERQNLKKQKNLLLSLLVAGFSSLFLSTTLAHSLYENIDFLSNIQFPWRMLSTFMIVPALLLTAMLHKSHQKLGVVVGLVFVLLVLWGRLPQVYSKNYAQIPQSEYYFSIDNLHSQNMNPVWTGNTTEYPVYMDDKVGILEGMGELSGVEVKNSSRNYLVQADSELRMIDRTFYYPGWHVYVDGVETQIEFQDPNHRGVITYTIPEGKHEIQVVFENTKTVLAGNYLSILSMIAMLLLVLRHRPIQSLLNKYI